MLIIFLLVYIISMIGSAYAVAVMFIKDGVCLSKNRMYFWFCAIPFLNSAMFLAHLSTKGNPQ